MSDPISTAGSMMMMMMRHGIVTEHREDDIVIGIERASERAKQRYVVAQGCRIRKTRGFQGLLNRIRGGPISDFLPSALRFQLSQLSSNANAGKRDYRYTDTPLRGLNWNSAESSRASRSK